METAIYQKACVGITTLAALTSLSKPVGGGATLLLRGAGLLSAALVPEEKGIGGTLFKTATLSSCVLGIAAQMTSLPSLLFSSIALDFATNLTETLQNFHQSHPMQASLHGCALSVDALLLAGVALASWELMVVAAAVHTAVMLSFGICLAFEEEPLHALCFFALSALSFKTALRTAQWSSTEPLRNITIENPYPNAQLLVEEPHVWNGIAAVGQPGQNVSFVNKKGFRVFLLRWVFPEGIKNGGRYRVPLITTVTQPALEPARFGTLPFGPPVNATLAAIANGADNLPPNEA